MVVDAPELRATVVHVIRSLTEVKIHDIHRIHREEGKVEGKAESRLEIARNMKSLGIATKLIISATGLTAGEIENL